MSTSTASDRQVEAFRYLDLDGQPATGVVWAPGPGSRTLWVIPYAGARAADAVVVKLAKRLKGGVFDGEHRQVNGWERPPSANGCPAHSRLDSPAQFGWDQLLRLDHHFAPKLPEADWRAAVDAAEQLALKVAA